MFVIEFRGNRSCAQCTPSELLSMAQFCDSLKLVSLCALDWHNVEWLLFRADRSLATVTEKPPTKLVKDENWTTNQPKYKDILLLICFQSRLWIRKIQCTFTMSSINSKAVPRIWKCPWSVSVLAQNESLQMCFTVDILKEIQFLWQPYKTQYKLAKCSLYLRNIANLSLNLVKPVWF